MKIHHFLQTLNSFMNFYSQCLKLKDSLLNSIMALSSDLIIIKNYKIMAPVGFEPGSVWIVYVLPDPVCLYANIVSLYPQKEKIKESPLKYSFCEDKNLFQICKKLQGISILKSLLFCSGIEGNSNWISYASVAPDHCPLEVWWFLINLEFG